MLITVCLVPVVYLSYKVVFLVDGNQDPLKDLETAENLSLLLIGLAVSLYFLNLRRGADSADASLWISLTFAAALLSILRSYSANNALFELEVKILLIAIATTAAVRALIN